MGTRRQRERQEALWYRNELPVAPGHPFYRRLNECWSEKDSMRSANSAAAASTRKRAMPCFGEQVLKPLVSAQGSRRTNSSRLFADITGKRCYVLTYFHSVRARKTPCARTYSLTSERG